MELSGGQQFLANKLKYKFMKLKKPILIICLIIAIIGTGLVVKSILAQKSISIVVGDNGEYKIPGELDVDSGLISFQELIDDPINHADHGTVYTKDDNKLYFQNSDGATSTVLISSGGFNGTQAIVTDNGDTCSVIVEYGKITGFSNDCPVDID